MKRAILAGAVSLVWGLVASIDAYAVVRVVQFFVYPDPNPALLVWSAHAGYFWRVLTVFYAGGIAAFVALLVARQDVERVARPLVPAVTSAAVALALQVAFFP